MHRSLASATLVAVALLLTAGPSRAQKPDQKEREAKARKHFERGEAHQRLEQWDQAAAEYLRAYEAMPHPIFLFNVAQVHRLGGDVVAAVDYYERYLELQPKGVEADFAREYIEEHREAAEAKKRAAEAARAREAAAAEDDAAAGEVEPDATETALPETEESTAGGPIEVPPPETDDTPGPPGRGLRIGGIASGASGLVLFVTGVGFGVRAKNIAGELEDLQMWSPDQDARFREGEDAERTSIILYSIGAAAVVTGGVLYLLGRRAGSSADESLTIAPAVDHGFGGVVATGRF